FWWVFLKKRVDTFLGIFPICGGGAGEAPVLSYTQESQWFLWQPEPESSAYHTTTELRLTGGLALETARHGFGELLA
ncbi:hypothetical protein, partial [Pseudomonas chlororaphis]|uniref:hypothetical protein n=1 Tax=Pseudomonas chlororaphis TaxID=587753 RepID=UPI003C1C1B70